MSDAPKTHPLTPDMLANTNEGDTLTFAQISQWLTDAGFIDVRSLPSPGPSPLILATRRP